MNKLRPHMNMKQVKLIEKVGKDVIEIPVEATVNLLPEAMSINGSIETRNGGRFKNKAYYLPEYIKTEDAIGSVRVDWVLGKDNEDMTVLIPVRKGMEWLRGCN